MAAPLPGRTGSGPPEPDESGVAGAELPSVRAAFSAAGSKLWSHGLPILALLAGWAGVWVAVETLVIGSGSAPGRPLWTLLHLTYFWGTAHFEAAVLVRALEAFGGGRRWRSVLCDLRRVLRLFALKMLLLPVLLVGTALLVVPGLYLAARYGFAAFFVVDRGSGLRASLAASRQASQGRRLELMKLCLAFLLLNVLGAALLGLGLLVTVPMTALAGAHVFRTASPA